MPNVKRMIAVMQAHDDGATIQALDRHESPSDWFDIGNPTWNWGDYEYRVKPREPLVIYVNQYGSGLGLVHTTLAAAKADHSVESSVQIDHRTTPRRTLKFIEVIED